jgi:hypothetical protein
VLDYGVRLRQRYPEAKIGLLQLLPSLPPELLEFGGAEDPDRERRLDAHLKSRQHEWLAQAEATAQLSLEAAAATLREAGVPAASLEQRCMEPSVLPHSASALADDILQLARAHEYGTIVVHRGLETATGEDLAAMLEMDGDDIVVCLVE